jgi:hypothetical protein
MERFNYPNLNAVYEEDASILRLLELESYGDRADESDEIEEAKAKANAVSEGNTYG